MVQIELTITALGDTESGIITVKRVDDGQQREMGKIRYDSPADRKWWLMVLMEMHPYVSLGAESRSYEPAMQSIYSQCCSH